MSFLIKTYLTSFFLVCIVHSAHTQLYKELMYNNSINYYDVVREAEDYFKDRDKGKGSGWKGFQRWAVENEFKYYPDGNRQAVDPLFSENQYREFVKNNPTSRSLYPNGWNELGPRSVGLITGHYSFGMGRIVSFYVDPNDDHRMYLGSRTGGFWKTLDGGDTWSGGSTDFLLASGVNTITASPTNPDSVLININNSTNHYTHGIYRSVDGGSSWSLSNFNIPNLGWGSLGTSNEIFKIKYHPTIPNLIFVGTKEGLYRSDDNLATWIITLAVDDFTDIDFHTTDPDIIYAYAKSNPDYIYVSNNAGITFTTTAFPSSSGGVGTVAVSQSCADCVYYCSNNGIWKSIDNGASFAMVSSTGISDAGFAVSDVDDSNILAGYLDAFFSTDGGVNFSQVTYWSLGNTNGAGSGHQISYQTSTDYIHADLQSAECIHGVFYAVTDGFLVKSVDNGANWEILSEEIGIRMNYNLGVSQSNHDRTICGSQDNGISLHTETGWVEMYGADGMEGIIQPLNDDWIIGSTQNGSRRRTFDGGLSTSSVTPSGQSGYWIAPLLYDPNEQMRVYSFGENVYRSDDFGDSWTNVGTPSFTGKIYFASIAENNSQLLVVTQSQYIELSSDGGATFTNIKGSLPNYSIRDVVFDPNDDNTIIVVYARYQEDNSKVYITQNQGTTWQNITYNLGDMPIRSVVIDHTDASTIYLGTEIGVYKKMMAGTTWTLYNTSLPNMSVKELEIMWGSNTLRATTWGRGLWEYTLDGRLDYPAILTTSISDPPTLDFPRQSEDQYVTSSIAYDNTLTKVWLEWSLNTPTFGNVISMSNSSGNEWISDSPIPDQPAGTKIFFKVFAIGNAADTTETYKFQYTQKPFRYCNGLGSSSQGNLYLNNVTINNMTNISGNNLYTYYSDSLIEFDLNETYNISLNANTGWESNDFGAWIDYNKDAIFSINEVILNKENSSGSASGNFTIPLDAIVGDTVRIRLRLGYWNNSLIPCGTTLGEVEDYPAIITDQGALPIELLSFDGEQVGKKIQLYWTTATEINNDYFTVERLDHNNSWQEVAEIKGAGNSSAKIQYTAVDKYPLRGYTYYRLKNTDYSGHAEYSEQISISFENTRLEIFPNPAKDFISVSSDDLASKSIKIFNTVGKDCSVETKHNSTQGTLNIDLSNMSAGVYFLSVYDDQSRSIIKFVITR